MRGFVIGNGESRRGFDLSSLEKHGLVYGCNALYREYSPKLLFVHDSHMKEEVKTFYKKEFAFVDGGLAKIYDKNNNLKKVVGLNHQVLMTGIAAAYFLCSINKATEVFLLGFDPFKKGNFRSCLYDGTQNYPKKIEKSVIPSIDRSNSDIRVLATEFRNVTFYRVGDKQDLLPHSWTSLKNFKFITYPEFKKVLL